jgi:hypothetical protein
VKSEGFIKLTIPAFFVSWLQKVMVQEKNEARFWAKIAVL